MDTKITLSIFRRFIESIVELLNKSVMDFKKDGLSLQAMDTAHISLVEAKIPKDMFINYQCSRTLSLGVSLTSLVRILKGSSDKDVLSLCVKDSSPNILQMMISSYKLDRVTEYEVHLFSLETEALEMNDVEFTSKVTLPSSDLARYFRDISQFGNTITFQVSNEELLLICDNSNIKAKIHLKQGSINQIKCEESINQSYASHYLNVIGKAALLSEKVTLHLGCEAPLLIEYKLENTGFIKFYLVSKVSLEYEGTSL